MAGQADGVLAIWLDSAPEGEAMLNEWFNREHHRERVNVPGFVAARRYVSLGDAPRYFVFYRTRAVDVLTAPSYLERLNHPTPWTRRAMPHFRNVARTACRVVERLGHGEGGIVATLRFGPQPGAGERLRTWVTQQALPDALAAPGMIAAELWQGDPEASNLPTEERRLRGADDVLVDWVVWLSGNHPEQVQSAQQAHLGDAALERHGGTAPVVGTYRLLFALQR